MNPVKLSKPALYTSWILQLVVAFVLLQTIPFKFSGAPETVALFKAIGAEPWGRYVVGVFELVGGVLILVPKTIWLGALVSGFTMLGAVLTHLFKIGITVKDAAGDVIFGPDLFIQAAVAMIFSFIVLYLRRNQMLAFFAKKAAKGAVSSVTKSVKEYKDRDVIDI